MCLNCIIYWQKITFKLLCNSCMEFTKVINFIRKYKTAIFLPIICFLQFLASFYYDLWIVATVFSVTLLVISDFSEIIYYMLFFQMFSTCGDFSVISTFVASGLIILKYIIGLVKHTEKFYPMPFILTCLISLFFSSYLTKFDIHGLYQGSSFIVALFLVYLVFVYREKIKLQKCADFLICGILATASISFITLLFKNSSFNIFDGMEGWRRLKLLTENENSLSIYCSLTLSYYVSSIINGKGNLFKNITFSVVAIVFGLSTLSKCFLVICTFIILYLFFMLIWKYKLKSISFIIPTILLLALISFIFKGKISTTFGRFFTKIGKFNFSDLTTGRSDLWTIYINKITSTIPNMLFGVGLFNERLIEIGPHNLLIHILYRMGFIGLIALCVLAYFYYRNSNKSLNITIKNCLPVLVFIMISLIESFF